MIYLDNHTITQPCQGALDAFDKAAKSWASPYSPHRVSDEVRNSLSDFYEKIYDFLGASKKDTFIFTASGAEAVNQVLVSVFTEVTSKEGKNHFITTSIEDAPTLLTLKRFEEQHCSVTLLPVAKDAKIDIEELKKAINPKTALVSLSYASGLLGSIQDLHQVAEVCRENQVLLHVDMSAAAGKMEGKFQELGIDYLTLDGSLIHSVRSSGGVMVKNGAPITSLIVGGIDQMQLRAGHLDVPSFIAFAEACRQANLFLDQMNMEVARLKIAFEKKLLEKVSSAKVLFQNCMRLPNVSVLSFPGVQSETLLYFLNQRNIFAAVGGGTSQHLSRLLHAAGFDAMTCASSLTMVLSRYTTEEDLDDVIDALKEIIPKLQKISSEVSS